MTLITTDAASRAVKLHNFFRDVLGGKRAIKTPNDARLFLEAICNQQPATVCIERICAKPNGLDAVRSAVRSDLSPDFIKSSTLVFINYLSDPAIKALVNGQLLQELLLIVVDPPTAWSAIVTLFLTRQIPEGNLRAFGWLAHEVLSFPSSVDVDLTDDLQSIVKDDGLLRSCAHETRELGYKVKHVLELKTASSLTTQSHTPGGRHDNDFADFRQILIYPTTDEFLSTATPFYRTVSEVSEIDENTRESVHLDNQYRLLREDMLAEFRSDLQIAMGKKKGNRKAMVLGNLWPIAIGHGDERRGKKCVVELQCHKGLEILSGKGAGEKRAFLKDHVSFLRNDAFGVLCRGENIFGFAFVERNVDQLVMDPPVVSLRFTDASSLEKALIALKMPVNVNFILVDTPVFAYEPILKGLKSKVEIPLAEHILHLGRSADFTPNSCISNFVAQLQEKRQTDGSVVMRDNDLIRLDKSQADSLLNALTTPVAQIQGPPGKLCFVKHRSLLSHGLTIE